MCSRRLQTGSDVIPNDPLGNTARLLAALALDAHSKRGFDGIPSFLQRRQRHPRPNPRIHFHRSRKPHTIQSIVHREPHTALDGYHILNKVAHQPQRQKSMRDGRSIRRFRSRARPIQMNPLSILGSLGELRNPLLRHTQPLRHTNLAPNKLLQLSRIHNDQRRHPTPNPIFVAQTSVCAFFQRRKTTRNFRRAEPSLQATTANQLEAATAFLLLLNSSFAMDSTCASSGPSAKRNVLTIAHELAKNVSCETPAPPCA